MGEHSVKGRRKSDGEWELLYPKLKKVMRYFLWIFPHEENEPEEIVGRYEAVRVATQFWNAGKHQDVIILKFNDSFDSSDIIWKNGQWYVRTVNTDLYE